MTDSVDIEINTLRERISFLENQKKELCSPVDNFKVLSDFISERKRSVDMNRYSKSVPLAKYYDEQKVLYLNAIFNILVDLDNRLTNLE